MIGLLLNRYVMGAVGAGVLVAAIFWAGDHFGFNAHRYAACKSETERRNRDIARANAIENAAHEQEEAARARDSEAFAGCPVQQCILTEETARCLNLLR